MLIQLLLTLSLLATGYASEIAKERSERDRLFADPLRSPLATVAIRQIDREALLIGSDTTADLVLQDPSVRGRHARLNFESEKFILTALEGRIYTIEGQQPVAVVEWRQDEQVRVGRFHLWLQIHPVAPVIRVLDPASAKLKSFHGLVYFPVDPGWRLRGTIEPQAIKEYEMIDTQGWKRTAYVHGKVKFAVEGRPQALDLILFTKEPQPDDRFMLIFQDATSGKESYPACRYLWIPFQPDGEIEVDFNRAVNPSCAYGGGYACPLPLPGNRLDVAVRAGEKKNH